ncbi:MAG: c-type cytochrome, partial [Rhodanobacteraceae bacterium]
MRTSIRRIQTPLLIVAGIAVLLVAGIYASSEWTLRRTRDVPLPIFEGLSSPTAADLTEGERLAVIVGCWAGCHGAKGQGGSDDLAGWYAATAPTLSDVLPKYSDAELVRLVRFGVKRDGTTAIGMTSGTFYALGDTDLRRIFAHLRAQPPSPPVARDRVINFSGRWAIVTGAWKTSADEVDPLMPRWGELPHDSGIDRGRYLVSVTCTECHGLDLQG